MITFIAFIICAFIVIAFLTAGGSGANSVFRIGKAWRDDPTTCEQALHEANVERARREYAKQERLRLMREEHEAKYPR